MNKPRKILAISATMMLMSVGATESSATEAKSNWYDTYYQYRVPVTLEVKETGWNAVPIDASTITEAVNKNEELKFDPLWFAWNQLKVVEVDDHEKVLDPNVRGGFCLVPESDELFVEEITGKEQKVQIPTGKGAYYLVRYSSQGGGQSPLLDYAQIFPIGNSMRKHAYMSSYEPPLLQQELKERECLLISDGQLMTVRVKGAYVGDIKKISVKKVRIVFLAEFDKPGRKNWMIYYQPMLGHYLTIPELKHAEMPKNIAKIDKAISGAQKYVGRTRYRLASNDHADIWFADTTVKLTPQTAAPDTSSNVIHIASAKNEAQSFQIVLRPKQPFKLKRIVSTDLRNGRAKISSKNIDVHAVDYVPIKKNSYITPTSYLGKMGDPLVAISSKTLSPAAGNYVLWVTVKTPADAPAGVYKGKLEIQGREESVTVPVSLTVYDFALPEYATFRSDLGGKYFVKPGGEGGRSLLQFHGMKTKKELKKLTRKYYDLMSINKFYPGSVVLFTEIGMNWSPPPHGYNVNKPGNYFELYDWDFTEFNRDLKHYIDDLKVNSICLTHTNPTVCNMFKHLPGRALDELPQSTPHVTMAWQTFRERTFVAYGKKEGDAFYDETIEISVEQFDRLTLDYYRTIAENLEKHGWLDRFYICFDETSNMKRMLHVLRLLKSDPLTARFKVVACIQSLEYFDYKENPEDDDYAFNGLITYMPQNDENYNRWEKYFFTDYDITPERSKLWNYATTTSRLAIDVPGINNRMIALDIFNRGGSGFLVWDTFIWESPYGDPVAHPWPKIGTKNPWIDPYTRFGNGTLGFFYPPDRDGLSKEPDFTVTPSLRVMTYRESVDDYEYAHILEDLVIQGREKGVDVSEAEQVIKDMDRFFFNSVQWSQNDAWYLDLRDRMAAAIVDIKQRN